MTDPQTNDSPPPWQGDMARTATAVFEYVEQRKKVERAEGRWRILKRVVYVAIIGAVFIAYGVGLHRISNGQTFDAPTVPSVALITIGGEISENSAASATKIVPLIEKACAAPMVKIVALNIDSPGGSPTEAERIVAAIKHCSANGAHKPVYALIGSLGASAAYMIAMNADTIVASKYALVGSIGAIIRYVDASEAVNRLGLNEKVFRSGPLKGGPSNFSPTSPEDARLNEEVVTALGRVFLADAIKARGSRLKAPASDLESGRIWTSDDALAMGLIDQQGVIEDLKGTTFKDLKVRTYAPAPSFVSVLGVREFVRGIVTDVLAPSVR